MPKGRMTVEREGGGRFVIEGMSVQPKVALYGEIGKRPQSTMAPTFS